MKILVCVKQVIDPDSPLEIGADRTWVRDGGRLARRMNRYDEFALEEAVLIRETLPGTVVDAVTLGPGSVGPVLVKALEKGADKAFHLLCEGEPLAAGTVSSGLAGFIRGSDYDLVLSGVLSEDLMQGQTGPMIAARLGLPYAGSVMRQRIDPGNRVIEVACEREGGYLQSLVLPLPCVLGIQSGINRPRYPSLSNVMRAKTAQVPVMPAETGGLPDLPAVLELPPRLNRGSVIEGSLEEKAERLLDILHERSLL